MNKFKKAACFGAGGGACALLPILTRLMDVVIIDGDNYEPENYKRQFPALDSTENKAKTLAGLLQKNTMHKVDFLPVYVEGLSILNNPEMSDVDLLIGTVDNHESRHIIMDLASVMGVPALLAGNEENHGECHTCIPGLYDPRQHHEFEGGEPAPFSCNSDMATKVTGGQSFLANALGAGALLHCLLSLENAINPRNTIVYSRIDPFSSIVKRAKDYDPQEVDS